MLLETNTYTKGFSLPDSDYTPSDIRLLQMLQVLIEKDFRENRDVRVYPRKLSVSLKVLMRLTKAYWGKTVYEVLQERIHKEALYLLKSSMVSVKEISYSVGCKDTAYFCRCFKQIEGISPLQYRKRYQKLEWLK